MIIGLFNSYFMFQGWIYFVRFRLGFLPPPWQNSNFILVSELNFAESFPLNNAKIIYGVSSFVWYCVQFTRFSAILPNWGEQLKLSLHRYTFLLDTKITTISLEPTWGRGRTSWRRCRRRTCRSPRSPRSRCPAACSPCRQRSRPGFHPSLGWYWKSTKNYHL